MRNAICCLFLFLFLQSNAQKYANIWYFGTNAGIDFNTTTPTALSNGMINTYEGVTSICDSSGSLLFYSDGITIWDRNHTQMPDGFGLLGAGSSSQSAMVVPQPGTNSIFYLFTVRDGGAGGLSYSKIDMSLNGGDGDVIPGFKNIALVTPTAEKLHAVTALNGTDIWVAVHEWTTNNFYAYLVTPTGINPPVISSVGLVTSVTPNQIGCMKFSHDGLKLAVATTYESTAELFDFDKATGVISNPITFTGIEDPYGVEFSPDNSKLYFGSRAPYTTKAIYQYDLNAGNPAAIIASKTYVFQSTASANNGSIQLGPDKKIYITRDGSPFLEVINDPNQPAATCGYVLNGFDLSPKTSQQGLPNFVSSFFSSVSVQNFCFGDSTYFSISASGSLGAQWNFDDPSTGTNNVAYVYNPAHLFSAPGTYQVELIQYLFNGSTDTSYTTVVINNYPLVNLGADTSFCTGGSFLLNAGTGFPFYQWQDSSSNSTFTATTAGIYWVRVTENGCSSIDSVILSVNPCSSPNVNFYSSDTSFCEKQCLDFYDLSSNNPTSWQWFFPGADSLTSNLQNPIGICYNSYGSFDVTLIACNAAGCDTLIMPGFINEYQSPSITISISNDTLYAPPGYTYQWYSVDSGIITNATNYFYYNSFPGNYYVIVTDSNGCIGSSNIVTINGISLLSTQEGILFISPNPNQGNFTLNINPVLSGYEIKIYNSLGQTVTNFTSSRSQQHTLKINLPELPSGYYLLELTTAKRSWFHKFMLE